MSSLGDLTKETKKKEKLALSRKSGI